MKLPRDLSGREMVKALQRLGFAVIRQEGSHIRLAKGRLRLCVPAHQTLAPGTLKSILRQSGISMEEFQKALK